MKKLEKSNDLNFVCLLLLQKGCTSSNSFLYERKPLNRPHETIVEEEEQVTYHNNPSKYSSPIKSRLTVNPSEDNNSLTLTHTVSFYRRQQTQNISASPVVRKVVHSNENAETDGDSTDMDEYNGSKDTHSASKQSQEAMVQDKIKSLLDNVGIQQQQISQASNALNTCASTVEFSGSTESVVAEWKLLVASK